MELAEAETRLIELDAQISKAGEDLNDTLYQIEQTDKLIKETSDKVNNTKEKIAEYQEQLSERIASDYKGGQASAIDVILEARSFEELANTIYYQNKINGSDAETIERVNNAREELEEEQASLEALQKKQKQLKDKQEEQIESLGQAQKEQKEYVESLSEELKTAIEEERLQELKDQQEEAARRAAELFDFDPDLMPEASRISEKRQTILAAAYSQIGVPYVWAGEAPGEGLDCSGFTMYCYGQAGIWLPHSAGAQSTMARVTTTPKPGDLVFWLGGMNDITGNHVAIYIGDGLIIHAYYGGVQISSLLDIAPWGYTFIGSITD